MLQVERFRGEQVLYARKSKGSRMMQVAVCSLVLLCTLQTHTIAGDKDEWSWRMATDPEEQCRTRRELDSILAAHDRWVSTFFTFEKREERSGFGYASVHRMHGWETEEGRAVFVKADLDSADFRSRNLSYAVFDGSDLKGARFDSAYLYAASFRNCRLNGASFVAVEAEMGTRFDSSLFTKTDLSRANLATASFVGADFIETILDSADLYYTDLKGASFYNAIINGAKFYESDLSGAIFEPVDLPDLPLLSFARGIDRITYSSNPSSVVGLREEFANRGFRKGEREVICALRRHDQSVVSLVAFDLTCEYGSNLSRPWIIIATLHILSSIIYFIYMYGRSGSGIIITYPRDPLIGYEHLDGEGTTPGEDCHHVRIHNRTNHIRKSPSPLLKVAPLSFRLLGWALFFSTISAFNIGFRNVNFGRWLRGLTRKEFGVASFGWVRVVSGIQSLITVYLFALWLLCFTGTPFK